LGKSGEQFLLLSDYLNQMKRATFAYRLRRVGGWRVGIGGAGLALINILEADIKVPLKVVDNEK
jgi:hypothetical protein